jgi:hypothetical protein
LEAKIKLKKKLLKRRRKRLKQKSNLLKSNLQRRMMDGSQLEAKIKRGDDPKLPPLDLFKL